LIIRVTFNLTISDDAPASVVKAAGYRAAVAAEGTVENETNKGATAGPVRITIVANEAAKKGSK
jgi:hypothetical protein